MLFHIIPKKFNRYKNKVTVSWDTVFRLLLQVTAVKWTPASSPQGPSLWCIRDVNKHPIRRDILTSGPPVTIGLADAFIQSDRERR